MINKALSIQNQFYLNYLFLFVFDNATSHSIYVNNALQIKDMKKTLEVNNQNCTLNGLIATIFKSINQWIFKKIMGNIHKKKSKNFEKSQISFQPRAKTWMLKAWVFKVSINCMW